jgi:hypothetical protein
MKLSTIAYRGRAIRDDIIVGLYQDEPTLPLWYVRTRHFGEITAIYGWPLDLSGEQANLRELSCRRPFGVTA